MIEIKIPQEINKYEAKMVGPFTFRQALCGGIAAVLSWVIYNNLKGMFDQETIIGIIFVISCPAALIGWIKPYGMPFEKFFVKVFFSTLISPTKRYFKSTDVIEALDKKAVKQAPKVRKKDKTVFDMNEDELESIQKKYRKNMFM